MILLIHVCDVDVLASKLMNFYLKIDFDLGEFIFSDGADDLALDENAEKLVEIPVGMLLIKIFLRVRTRKIEIFRQLDTTAVRTPNNNDTSVGVCSVVENKPSGSEKVEWSGRSFGGLILDRGLGGVCAALRGVEIELRRLEGPVLGRL